MSEMTQILGTVAMEPKGNYDSSTYYEKLNTVLYNDSTYMAKEGVQGEDPSTSSKWQLIGGGVTDEDVSDAIQNSIEDSLTSESSTKSLSAKQGKELKIMVDDKINLLFGATTDRPTANIETGQMYFDTTLTKPIWYDGSNWVDATGTTV